MSPRSASALSQQASTSARGDEVVTEVALLRRTPRGTHVFDYLAAPGSVEPGDLVRAPFRNAYVPGIVVALKLKSDVRAALKRLDGPWQKGFVGLAQLELCRRISTHYGVSLGAALTLACPALPLRRAVTIAHPPAKLTRSTKAKPTVICYSQAKQRETVVQELVMRVTSRGHQVLLLVPLVHELERWAGRLGASTVTYHSDLSQPQLRKIRDEVQSGNTRVVVGTRAALYLPFQSLGGVVVDSADNENYKQYDQNPRYDGLEVAAWLAELWKAPLAYVSAAPPMGAWDSARRGSSTWRQLAGVGAKVTVADLRQEAGVRPRPLIGAELVQEITNAIAGRERVFLYLNRRGDATAVLCRDCGYRPACPSCSRSFAWNAASNQLACYHCDTTQRVPLPCPKCGGANVTHLGGGLAELEREVRNTWPGISTNRIEGTATTPTPGTTSARLVLGTQAALGVLALRDFALIGMVAPDTELSLPEYRASEEVWATAKLFQTSGTKHLVVQTRRPEHHVWQSLQSNNVDGFYQAELAVRKSMAYPPFVNLVRFTAQARDEQAALALAREVRAKLQAAMQSPLELRGPYPDYYRSVRGRYLFHLLLRYPRTGYDPAQLWPLLPDDILIDRHPYSVLG